MDTKEFIERLNEDLQTEYQSIVLYIQHTATMSTCYAHQSRFATSMGANVSQGQVIGYTGCTGRCFGHHLHFEVRINGSVVNPMNYL